MKNTTNTRIKSIDQELVTPKQIIDKYPASPEIIDLVIDTRKRIEDAMKATNDIDEKDKKDTFVVIVGPCSIHNTDSAIEYGEKLSHLIKKYEDKLTIVMRVYFEKPRTTVGWKGLINDPDLDQSFNINKGIDQARMLLIELHKLGVPAGTEYLDLIIPQYFNDLISWGAIGARTTESQCHRQLASGLSCPVGFKNGTGGNTQIAIDALQSARGQHTFLGSTLDGRLASFTTTGNPSTHVILRGGIEPNYDHTHVIKVTDELKKHNVTPRVMIDCSHANSHKDYTKQSVVLADICKQIKSNNSPLFGVMIESNLTEGKQKLTSNPKELQYGVSITDGCVGWEETESLLSDLYQAVKNQ